MPMPLAVQPVAGGGGGGGGGAAPIANDDRFAPDATASQGPAAASTPVTTRPVAGGGG